MKRLLWILATAITVFTLAILTPVFAQERGAGNRDSGGSGDGSNSFVVRTINAQNSDPVAGVLVKVYNQRSQLVLTLTTARDGMDSGVLGTGDYTLVAEHPSYQTLKTAVKAVKFVGPHSHTLQLTPIPAATPSEPNRSPTGNPDTSLGECVCQDLKAWLDTPSVATKEDGLRQIVEVTIPYRWSLDCKGGSSNSPCSGTLKFNLKAEAMGYVTNDGARLKADPTDETVDGKPKGEATPIKVTCQGKSGCDDNTGGDTIKYSFRLAATDKVFGKVLVPVTIKCNGRERTWNLSIDVDSTNGADKTNEGYGDDDGDGWLNNIDNHRQDPTRH